VEGAAEGTLVKEGGEDRVIFRLSVEVEKLEVVFNYESPTAAPLGAAYVERVIFCLGVHPTSIVIDASLGNMKAVDGALPEVLLPLRTLAPWRGPIFILRGLPSYGFKFPSSLSSLAVFYGRRSLVCHGSSESSHAAEAFLL
jgi:hypothetical protein